MRISEVMFAQMVKAFDDGKLAVPREAAAKHRRLLNSHAAAASSTAIASLSSKV